MKGEMPRRQFLGNLLKTTVLATTTPPLVPSSKAAGMATSKATQSYSLWYRQPAVRWLEALPVGNGRLGAMVFGGMTEEKLALNEVTFWSGAPSTAHENPEGREAFDKIRELFKTGDSEAARQLVPNILGRELNYGTNLPAGELLLIHHGLGKDVRDYRRELSLDLAIASTTFVASGVIFRREVIASHPAGLLALHLSADRPGQITFTLRYQGQGFPSRAETRGADTLVVSGHAFENKHSDGKTGVAFEGRFCVLPKGGKITAGTDSLDVAGADAATILIALNTDYLGRDASASCAKQIALGRRQSWQQMRARHIADHQRLFQRVSLDLGSTGGEAQPTDERLTALRQGAQDPHLAALFFQYGRYLTIAGSRTDSPLPLNLQGIWNDGLAATMGWTCDYHLDINTQQNYWPTEIANLSECAQPLFRFIESLQTPGQRTARQLYGIDHGWVCHVFSNAWGFTAPGWGLGWGLHVTGGAWIATHLWEHYLFTGDREFLRSRAYPALKGAAEFFLDYLFVDPETAKLLTGPSVSPERGGEDNPGCTHDRSIIFEIFSACIEASEKLGIDAEFRAKLQSARAQLPPFQIGRNGQLREWFRTDDGGETGHRHTSHLVGVFPLAQITPRGTPELAGAAERSLQLRTQNPEWEDVEWSAGNSVCYYARLGKGDLAHRNLIHLITSDTDSNLMTFSRGGIAGAPQNIFAIDGNTSGATGIAEMLLQSHTGEIDLLPALPPAWPTGKVTGLRARGNFTVDLEWKDGRVTYYRVASTAPREFKIRVNGEIRTERSKKL